ncbi:hypothetical protein CXG81DRAFT_25219 [Caulochytrium protostelioides]|uniref:Hyaluronan/mRNA-binding protein domain-containing protein n=1 Tax=Caulochytrium protostelioides TaxID=1555241 RepID=A0A4P9X9V5_9FUNG|nr:hypothetical protein CXG81DRAFT_25219 [Caulochytrium protostelioides]|eukprot:RKP02134.1 hypothetical protein CXG81DRAFT_25219 [Caulochytrium protostelioides]
MATFSNSFALLDEENAAAAKAAAGAPKKAAAKAAAAAPAKTVPGAAKAAPRDEKPAGKAVGRDGRTNRGDARPETRGETEVTVRERSAQDFAAKHTRAPRNVTRGQREQDRHSRTGLTDTTKKEQVGKGSWGKPGAEAEAGLEGVPQTPVEEELVEETAEEAAAREAREAAAKLMTLDAYLAQQPKAQPKAVRKANEDAPTVASKVFTKPKAEDKYGAVARGPASARAPAKVSNQRENRPETLAVAFSFNDASGPETERRGPPRGGPAGARRGAPRGDGAFRGAARGGARPASGAPRAPRADAAAAAPKKPTDADFPSLGSKA